MINKRDRQYSSAERNGPRSGVPAATAPQWTRCLRYFAAADRHAATTKAMTAGREVIYQAKLRDEQFAGYATF